MNYHFFTVSICNRLEKGSQEKKGEERDRKKKKLEESASKCRTLWDLVKNTNAVSADISEDDKDTDLESGPAGVNVVTIDSLAAESAEDHVAENPLNSCRMLTRNRCLQL